VRQLVTVATSIAASVAVCAAVFGVGHVEHHASPDAVTVSYSHSPNPSVAKPGAVLSGATPLVWTCSLTIEQAAAGQQCESPGGGHCEQLFSDGYSNPMACQGEYGGFGEIGDKVCSISYIKPSGALGPYVCVYPGSPATYQKDDYVKVTPCPDGSAWYGSQALYVCKDRKWREKVKI
jgi:hypothetical protein